MIDICPTVLNGNASAKPLNSTYVVVIKKKLKILLRFQTLEQLVFIAVEGEIYNQFVIMLRLSL